MKLLGSLTSPYVRKVRIVMSEKKLDYQFIAEDVWAADSQITQSNPLAKVPCLVMEGGEAVFDSRVIVEYLDALSPVGKLIRSQAWIDRQMVKVDAALQAMSAGLGDKPFCSGVHLSLSDIAVGCALAYLDLRFAHIDWRARHPNLARLYEKLSQRPSFIDTTAA